MSNQESESRQALSRAINIAGIIIVLGLVSFFIIKLCSYGKDERRLLRAFDGWARENVEGKVTKRTLTGVRKINNYGEFTDPLFVEYTDDVQMYKDLILWSLEPAAQRRWRLRQIMELPDSARTPRQVEQARWLQAMQGEEAPADVQNALGKMASLSQKDADSVGAGRGRMIYVNCQIREKLPKESTGLTYVFVSPEDAEVLTLVDMVLDGTEKQN